MVAPEKCDQAGFVPVRHQGITCDLIVLRCDYFPGRCHHVTQRLTGERVERAPPVPDTPGQGTFHNHALPPHPPEDFSTIP